MTETNIPSGPGSSTRDGQSPVRGLPGLIAANVSFIVAVLVYMGWAYESALYGYFHLSPAELGFGVQDYLLASPRLFNPVVVIAAVTLIAAIVTWSRIDLLATVTNGAAHKAYRQLRQLPELRWLDELIRRELTPRLSPSAKIPESALRRLQSPRVWLGAMGTALTVCAFALALVAQYTSISTYLLLGLFATGPLLLTRALREGRQGILPYTLAVVVTAVCVLWAGSLYAEALGQRAARGIAVDLRSGTAVAVSAVNRLGLSGKGITDTPLPSGYLYHYRYTGLRLLYMDAGTYYLLPQGWTPQQDYTYILVANDQTMFELYSGTQRTSYSNS